VRSLFLAVFLAGGLVAFGSQAVPDQHIPATQPTVVGGGEEKPEKVSKSSLVLLYDQIPTQSARKRALESGASPYLTIYQGVDPRAKFGTINSNSVVRAIEGQPLNSLPRFGLLDFESPYAEVLQSGCSDPRWAQTIATMVSTIQLVRAKFPNTLWSYYGVPFVPFWIDGTDWASASAEQRKAALDKIYQANAPLVKELDWINCSIYPVYDPPLFNPKDPNFVRVQGRAWRRATVSLSHILANGKPVIPMVSPYWQPNGVARPGFLVPRDQFIEDQVAVAVDAGATGIALWTGIESFIDLAVRGEPAGSERDDGFSSKTWRVAFTEECLSKIEPLNWSDPSVRAVLQAKTSAQICDSISWIREWESQNLQSKQSVTK